MFSLLSKYKNMCDLKQIKIIGKMSSKKVLFVSLFFWIRIDEVSLSNSSVIISLKECQRKSLIELQLLSTFTGTAIEMIYNVIVDEDEVE